MKTQSDSLTFIVFGVIGIVIGFLDLIYFRRGWGCKWYWLFSEKASRLEFNPPKGEKFNLFMRSIVTVALGIFTFVFGLS